MSQGNSFRRVSNELFDHTQRHPFTSLRMLCLSFIYKWSLLRVQCKISNNFHKEMRQDRQSLSTRMVFKQVLRAAFFGCKTINTYKPDLWMFDAPRARTSEIIAFILPIFTKHSVVTLLPEQYIAWMLRFIKTSDLKSLSDDVLLKVNEISLVISGM